MGKLYLSPSKVATYENCPREYFFKYVLKVQMEEESSNLGFGSAAATAFEQFVLGMVNGVAVDPVAVFRREWGNFTANNVVGYSSMYTEEGLTKTGEVLMSKLPDAWNASGFMVAMDGDGLPLVERRLDIEIGRGIYFRTKLDVAVYDRDCRLGIVDMKTPKDPSTREFTLLSDQLTAYQGTVEAHKASLGIEDSVSWVGYWEFLKRNIPKKSGTGPYIHTPEVVPARPRAEVDAYMQKVAWVAESIQAGRFPRTPRMAFNSPCSLCSFSGLCALKSAQGLKFRTEEDRRLALAA